MDNDNCGGDDDDGICETAGNNDDGDVAYSVFWRNAAVVSHNSVFCRDRYDAVSDHSDNGYF